MTIKSIIPFVVLTLALCSASAQSTKEKLSVYGAGRFMLQNNSRSGALFEESIIQGDTLAPDTVNPRKELSGFALFDLGFHFRPNNKTEIKAQTRVNGDLDGFWGAGIGFTFRELYIRGVLKDVIQYRVGDLDLKMTPFTIYNNHADLRRHSTSPLQVYSDINEYENFSRENRWRQQGLQTSFALNIGSKNTLDVHAHLTKDRQTDFFFVPDRLMSGGQLIFNRKGLGRIGYHVNGFWEIEETSQFAEGTSATTVHSLSAAVMPLKDQPWVFYGEGSTSYQGYNEIDNAPEMDNGLATTIGIRKPIKNEEWGYYGEWLSVSSEFRSPAAQSRRLNPSALNTNLPYQTNSELQRPVTIYDMVQDPNVYNRSIQYNLAEYNPVLSNAMPYGKATPNRQGLLVGAGREKDSTMVSKVSFDGGWLTEISGRGINEYRTFLFADAFVQLDITQQTGWKNQTLVELHTQFENTSRDGLSSETEALQGIGAVDLSSSLFEVSVSQELSDGFFVDLGVLSFNGSGNEFIAQRNAFDQVQDYFAVDYDLTETTFYGGVRFAFSANSNFLVQYRNSTIENGNDPANDYTWNQLMMVYNLFF